MPRIDRAMWSRIADVAAFQEGLLTAAQLREIGLGSDAVRRRCRAGGGWRRVLPGIYTVTPGDLTERQHQLAAVMYTRPDCSLTGVAALQVRGCRAVERLASTPVHVLIPHHRKRATVEFVRIERTKIWPAVEHVDRLPLTPVARSTVDASRQLRQTNDVRALVAEVLTKGLCTIDDLRSELWLGQKRHTAALKDAIELYTTGAASAPEMMLLTLWRATRLPEALWNVDLFDSAGRFVARPDVYVPEIGLVVEVDSREFHSEPMDWERTMERHARLTGHGLCVLHFTPRRIASDWPGVLRDIHGAIAVQHERFRPSDRIRTRPTAA